jgi:hypothetical protein
MENWDPILVSIQFQIAIFALAVPILLQVIVNLDQRYNSRHIIHLFKERPEVWIFGISLIATLIHIGFWLLHNTYFNWKLLVPNARVYIEGAIPTLLVVQVIWLLMIVRKVVIFYVPDLFMNFLNKIGIQEEKHFYAFADLMYSTVDRGEPKIAFEGSKLFLRTTNEYASKKKDRIISYKNEHYEFNLKLIYRLTKSDNYELTFLSYRAIGGFWFIENKSNKGVHESTYQSLWTGVTLVLDKQRTDLATHMWEQLHDYGISISSPYQSFTLSFWLENPKEKEIEFSRLVIFVSHVNAYALSNDQFSVLKHAFDYTRKKPYRFFLLPEDMNGVFQLFLYSYEHEYEHSIMRGMFYFPSLRGMKGEDQVKFWLRKYSALLFLRQYTITSRYTSRSSLDYPELPEDQSKKQLLLDVLDFFQRIVQDIRNDSKLLQALEMDHISDEWCRSNDKITPDEFFTGFREYLESTYDETEQNQEISPVKHSKFIESSSSILSDTDNYLRKFTRSSVDGEVNSYVIRDYYNPFERNAFLDNVPFDHGNFDSFTADSYSNYIKGDFVNTFHIEAKERFKVSNEIVFEAIDRLVGARDRTKFVIVNAGVYLGFLIRVLQVHGLSEDSFNEIQILNLNFGSNALGRTLFIMPKCDLPGLKVISPKQDLIEKMSLEKLNVNDRPVFGNVIDFKNRKDLREEYIPRNPNPERMAMAYLAARYQFSFRKDSRVIAFEPLHKEEDKERATTLDNINYDFFDK